MLNHSNALYYPHIPFVDPSWVKSMAMFYDNIYRIVPENVIPNDPEELEPLLEDPAIGKMLDPIPYSRAASERFLSGLQNWSAAALESGPNYQPQLTRLHADKIDSQIQKIFSELGYDESDYWFDVPQDLAANYMLFLAREIALQNELALITSEWGPWTATNYFNLDGRVDETLVCFGDEEYCSQPDPFAFFSLVISAIAPMNINEIPCTDILKFRSKRRDEIAALREAVYEFSKEVSRLEDPTIRRDAIDGRITTLKNALNDYRNSAGIIKAKGWMGAVFLGVPAPLALIQMFDIQHNALSYLAGGAFAIGGLFNLIASKRDLENLNKKTPVSCLFEIHRAFKGYTRVRGGGDINWHAFNCMEEYVND